MKISLTLRVLCNSKHHCFYLGRKQSLGVWLRGPKSGGLGGEASGDRSLKIQTRVSVRDKGHDRSDLPALWQSLQVGKLRVGVR